MSDFELTETGLTTPRLPEARALIVARWKEKFGANAQTASDSPDGLVIDVIALALSLAWQGVHDVHGGSYMRTAVDSAVDSLLDLFGRRRLGATASTASCVWYGDEAVLVSSPGSRPVASVDDTGDRFSAATSDGATVASAAGGPVVVRILEAVEGATYAVDVSTTAESSVVAGASDETSDIASALAAELADDNPSASVLLGGVDPDGVAVIVLEGIADAVVAPGATLTDPDYLDVRFGVRVPMVCEVTGPTAALAGSLNTIETPITGIDGVCSTADAVAGRTREQDPAFKARHIDQINSGSANAAAIRSRLLGLTDENGDPVLEAVRVFENRAWYPDAAGRPPNSFEVVWIGPTGEDAEGLVGSTIWEHGPIGIQPYGAIVSEVEDELGGVHEIGHSRGGERYLHVDVTIVPGEGYPSTGDPIAAVKSAIVAFLQPGGAGALGLGLDFYRFALGRPISMAVPGVASATITADATGAPGDSPALVASDVSVDDDEILRVDSSRVAVHL